MKLATVLTAFISITTITQAVPVDTYEVSKRSSSTSEFSQLDAAATFHQEFAIKKRDNIFADLINTVIQNDPIAKVTSGALNLDALVTDLAKINATAQFEDAGGVSDYGSGSGSGQVSGGLGDVFKAISQGFNQVFKSKKAAGDKRDLLMAPIAGFLTTLLSILSNPKLLKGFIDVVMVSIPFKIELLKMIIAYLQKVGPLISSVITKPIGELIGSGLITDILDIIFGDESLLKGLNQILKGMIGENPLFPNLGKIIGALLGQDGISKAIEKTGA